MNTVNGLDLGLQARNNDSPEVKYLGNLLVSAYCRNRLELMNIEYMGDLTDVQTRGIRQIESLEPVDYSVIHKLSEFYREQGDTAKAESIAGALWMNEKWMYKTIPSSHAARPGPHLPFSAAFDIDQLWKEQGEWKRVKVIPGFAGFAVCPGELRSRLPMTETTLACTQVSAQKGGPKLLSVSVIPGYPYSIWVNGERAVETRASDRWQGRRISSSDVLTTSDYRVQMKEGRNTIAIVFDVPQGKAMGIPPLLRCTFRERDGTPLRVDGSSLLSGTTL
jgi:hypothetical protein